MKQRWNGSVQSANTPTFDKEGIPRADYGLYRCMIIDVLYVDDDKNITKNSKNPEVLYEVIILGGSSTGQTLSFCRLASYLGGDYNYSERTLRKTTKDVSKIKLSDHDGDIVYVQFNQGHDAYPIIIALAKGINNKIGAKKSDAPRWIEGYNGFETLIDNKGQLTWNMKGGTTTNEMFKANTESLIKEEWTKDEKLIRTFKSGMVVTQDGKSDKIDTKTKGGAQVTTDGKSDKIEIKTSGGATISVDGKSKKISIKAGSTEVLIDGSGKISLKGEMIDLGSSVSDFVTKFTELATAFNTHTHQFIDLSPIPVPSVTFPPSAPLLVSVGSQTVKVQS
jgi:hypothetical protein